MSTAFLIDFGSTFTKLIAVDLDRAELIGRSQAPSTVGTDVREGLLQALAILHHRRPLFERAPRDLSVLEHQVVYASSSAAGGLRIAVVGNVPGLTVEAAHQAALGAGAKIVGSTAFKLTTEKIAHLSELRPDMLLLAGGADGGDQETMLHNARLLAASPLATPIIVAGNRTAGPAVCRILAQSGKEARLVHNVMPRAGTLAVESARDAIRALFMERIIEAKGLDQVKRLISVVRPPPLAVLDGTRLGAEGVAEEKGWGDLLLVDVGGATTDVHSIGHGVPAGEQFFTRGLAEAYAKRTVEGDLGIRFNAPTIVDTIGLDSLTNDLRRDFPREMVSRTAFRKYIERVADETASVPAESWHTAADAVLARAAVDLAVARHVGRRERIVARQGEAWVYSGKDLRDTRILIGTGGIFAHNPFAAYILSQPVRTDEATRILRPRQPRLHLDSSYLLYAVGLLSGNRPETALRIFQRYVTPIARQAPAV